MDTNSYDLILYLKIDILLDFVIYNFSGFVKDVCWSQGIFISLNMMMESAFRQKELEGSVIVY